MAPPRPRILTIAGSDSGGGAGIQADLKTFAAHGCYGLSVITALTAQNTCGVNAVMDATPAIVEAQLRAVLSDIGCDAAKTGMLSQPEIIATVAREIRSHRIPFLVVDPVMVSKSGHRLLAPEARETLCRELIPLASLITPNLDEVAELCGRRPATVDEMKEAARMLHSMGPAAVLVKGGHLADAEDAVDVLFDGAEFAIFRGPRLDARHTHGTGCTLSAAIAARLGMGRSLTEAVFEAKNYLEGAMQRAWELGSGIGPVEHLWQISPITPGEG